MNVARIRKGNFLIEGIKKNVNRGFTLILESQNEGTRLES